MTELKTLINNGVSIRQASRITGIDRQTIKYKLSKENISSKYKQGQRPKDFKSKWFKGDSKTSYGYKIIKLRDHPFSDKRGYILEHRLVMEGVVKRYLSKEEVVHHRNEIKSDNRAQNLFLFPNDTLHRCFHMMKKYGSKLTEEEFMNNFNLTEKDLA